MSDIKLTTSGDIDFTTNAIQMVTGLEAIRQDLDVRLQFFAGEWFLDTRWGMPYYQKILGKKNVRIPVVKSIIKDGSLMTPGVESVNDLVVQFTSATRSLSVSFRATCTDGEIVYDKELIF